MCRALVAFFCLALFEAGRLFAGETEHSPPPKPVPVAAAAPASNGEDLHKLTDRTAHLLKAADHLEAAGLDKEAARLRQDARRRAIRDDLLGRKESELECLQEEVDRLRALTGHVSTILIRTVVVEVDRRRLGLRSGEFDKMVGLAPADPREAPDCTFSRPGTEMTGITEINPAHLPLFREFLEKGAVRVLAEPLLTTTPGRRAEFLDGGLFPVRMRSANGEFAIHHMWFGTRVELEATLLPAGQIRLKAVVELRRKENVDFAGGDDGNQIAIASNRLSTSTEFLIGQTMTLGRNFKTASAGARVPKAASEAAAPAPKASRPAEPADFTELIVFVTPELVHSPIVPRAWNAGHEPAEAGDDSSDSVAPAVFERSDWDQFGPPMPVLRRRAGRE